MLIAFTLLVACSDGDDVVVTSSDSSSEVELGSGEKFEVRLESNPSTGYGWEVSAMTSPGVVDLVSQGFESSADENIVGASGTEVFVFRATDAGAGILRLEYVRPFDDPVVPERVVEYIVRIDGAKWPPDRDDSTEPRISTASAPDGAIQVGDLFNGDGAREVVVSGAVVWGQDGARLCEVLMESFPPQCGGDSVVIANPEKLDVTLETNGDVRWTQGHVDIAGLFDGTELVVD